MFKVLVADDDRFIRQLLRETLEEANLEIQVVESGGEVLRRILKQKFHILFLDIYMAGLDGLDVIPLVKEIDPELPIVVITGDTSATIRHRTRALGADYHLTKPLDPGEVKNLVKHVLQIGTFNHENR